MFRKKVYNRSKDKTMFSRTARKMKAINVLPNVARGGVRL